MIELIWLERGPGHAAAERHLGGFPLRRGFLYQGFLLLQTTTAGIHQQLSPDWRGSTPSSSFFCSSSPPTSLLETTHTHTVTACVPLSSWYLTPYYVSVLPLLCRWMSQTTSTLCGWKHAVFIYFEFDKINANYGYSACDRQIVTFTSCVLVVWNREAWGRIAPLFWEFWDFCLCEKTSASTFIDPAKGN